MWTVGDRERATDRKIEGAGKIDTMEESGRENKIERDTGSVMSEKERDRVGRKYRKKYERREGEISKERERQGWDNKERETGWYRNREKVGERDL